MRSTTLVTITGTEPATASTIANAGVSTSASSAFVNTINGSASLSIAITRSRSSQPACTGRSSPRTAATTSTLLARTCSRSFSAGSRRLTAVRRGSTRAITVPRPSVSPISTQSPVTGAISPCARCESESTRTRPSGVMTSHSPRSTRTTRACLAPSHQSPAATRLTPQSTSDSLNGRHPGRARRQVCPIAPSREPSPLPNRSLRRRETAWWTP